MPETAAGAGLIGPNAILQLLPVVERHAGRAERDALIARAGLPHLPDGAAMIPEAEAAGLHRALRACRPAEAPDWAAEAGRRTADYILAHRIPGSVQALLRLAPPALAAPLLARAVARHAWTFDGSGRFVAAGPWHFRIQANPLVRGETSDRPICHWHAAVFQRLYAELVASDCICRETACCAQPGAPSCDFRITRGP